MNRVFPQLDDNGRGMTDEFYASLEIYKSLLSNPNLIEEIDSVVYEANSFSYMKRAIQLGKEFCSKFNQMEE